MVGIPETPALSKGAAAAQLRLTTALQQNRLRVAIPLNFPEEPEMQIFM